MLHVGDVPTYASDLSELGPGIFGAVDEPFVLTSTVLPGPAGGGGDPGHPLRHEVDDARHRVEGRAPTATFSTEPACDPVLPTSSSTPSTATPRTSRSPTLASTAWSPTSSAARRRARPRLPRPRVIPHLYFWKSAKWLRGLEVVEHDRPGFWETNEDDNYADPFREQRYS